MKPLNEYPTPLADAVAYYSNDTQYGCGGYIVDKEDAQHLERKLALCRDALEKLTRYVKVARAGDSPLIHKHVVEWIDESIMESEQALDQTK